MGKSAWGGQGNGSADMVNTIIGIIAWLLLIVNALGAIVGTVVCIIAGIAGRPDITGPVAWATIWSAFAFVITSLFIRWWPR